MKNADWIWWKKSLIGVTMEWHGNGKDDQGLAANQQQWAKVLDFPKTFEYSREREFSDFWKNKGLVTTTSNGLKSKDSTAEFDQINTVILFCLWWWWWYKKWWCWWWCWMLPLISCWWKGWLTTGQLRIVAALRQPTMITLVTNILVLIK